MIAGKIPERGAWRVSISTLLAAIALALFAAPAKAMAPASLVNPFIGTTNRPNADSTDTFPGADTPFGMLQWGPDTPSLDGGSAYDFGDNSILGFSLTHLSGPGCGVFGDFRMLPTVGRISDPESSKASFSHADEQASPGYYAVTLGQPKVAVALAVTKRSGLGEFTFPSTTQANILINASSDQAVVTTADLHFTGAREITGSVSSGDFCYVAPDKYKVFFAARFDRPFAEHGVWTNGQMLSDRGEVVGKRTGAFVRFDTSKNRTVKMQVAISFASADGALRNLQHEAASWDIGTVRQTAAADWNTYLGRIRIAGGTSDQRQMFYTALYHAMLHPNIISDVDGRYPGFDGKTHIAAFGRVQYANFSGWDTYRTQTPLTALLAPTETSDMIESLLDEARQGGWLPKWPLVAGYTGVMAGDAADPIIAGAYAFGARSFDQKYALAAMIRGATVANGPLGQGWYVERPNLAEYMRYGYVPNHFHTNSYWPIRNGASETLEYAIADFSIAQFARALANGDAYETFMKRAQNWSNLFNTATGMIAPRDSTGAFLDGPIDELGQMGFQEGNAAQYTWMVPQNLHSLIRGMGGNAVAVARLDSFFELLNAGVNKPHAWLGNEPSIGSPWVYLSAGVPWRTQEVVRKTLTTLYSNEPAGMPGNDDLGTMSAWYVWAAMGLYPQNPAVRRLDIGSPLFSRIEIDAPSGPRIQILASNASISRPYVRSLRVNGIPTSHTWIDVPLHGTLLLNFGLDSAPNRIWGSAAADAPPSFERSPVHFAPATSLALHIMSPSVVLSDGKAQIVPVSFSNVRGTRAEIVSWKAIPRIGLTVTPGSGTLRVGPGITVVRGMRITARRGTASGFLTAGIAAHTARGAVVAPVAVIVNVRNVLRHDRIAYVQSSYDDATTPVDEVTRVAGPAIGVGRYPIEAAQTQNRLFVVNRQSKTISVIDTERQEILETIRRFVQPAGLLVAPDGRTLWISDAGAHAIYEMNSETLAVHGPIALSGSPGMLASAPDGASLYVANRTANSIMIIDVGSRRITSEIPLNFEPISLAITPNGRTIYVVDNTNDRVVPVDARTHNLGSSIAVGSGPRALAISPDGRILVVSNDWSGSITPIDLTRYPAVARRAIRIGNSAYDVMFSNSSSVLVVDQLDDSCVPVDIRTGRVGTPITVGAAPRGISH